MHYSIPFTVEQSIYNDKEQHQKKETTFFKTILEIETM